jgi:16S rRNA (guanine966-N2)-methyltransferase
MTTGGSAGGPSGKGSAGRVIAGTARATRLLAPGAGTRPLTDRLKQALFAILEPMLRQATVLDLFAGSGAGGIEALSRGAQAATFVERDTGAVAVLRANLERAHLAGPSATVLRGDAVAWLDKAAAEGHAPFDIVLLDPPYDSPDLLIGALERLGRSGSILKPGGLVVAKHFWRAAPPGQVGLLASLRTRRFGDSSLTFYEAAQGTEAQA